MNLSEKAAFIKGLLEGMNFDTTTNEGKLLKHIIDLLEDVSISISDLEDETARLNDYIEELDSDLAEVEEEVYGDYGCDCGCDDEEWDCDCCDDDCDCCDDDCDCDCDCEDCKDGENKDILF